MGTRKIKRRKNTRGRTIKLDPESMDMMNQQLQAFREKFGREAGPNDPVFFDPDADTPQPFPLEKYLEESTEAMVAAGIRPEIIYAHRKTGGLIVTEENQGKLSAEDIAEWEAAIDEYLEKTKGKPN
jgi:hypothetical protein